MSAPPLALPMLPVTEAPVAALPLLALKLATVQLPDSLLAATREMLLGATVERQDGQALTLRTAHGPVTATLPKTDTPPAPGQAVQLALKPQPGAAPQLQLLLPQRPPTPLPLAAAPAPPPAVPERAPSPLPAGPFTLHIAPEALPALTRLWPQTVLPQPTPASPPAMLPTPAAAEMPLLATVPSAPPRPATPVADPVPHGRGPALAPALLTLVQADDAPPPPPAPTAPVAIPMRIAILTPAAPTPPAAPAAATVPTAPAPAAAAAPTVPTPSAAMPPQIAPAVPDTRPAPAPTVPPALTGTVLPPDAEGRSGIATPVGLLLLPKGMTLPTGTAVSLQPAALQAPALPAMPGATPPLPLPLSLPLRAAPDLPWPSLPALAAAAQTAPELQAAVQHLLLEPGPDLAGRMAVLIAALRTGKLDRLLSPTDREPAAPAAEPASEPTEDPPPALRAVLAEAPQPCRDAASADRGSWHSLSLPLRDGNEAIPLVIAVQATPPRPELPTDPDDPAAPLAEEHEPAHRFLVETRYGHLGPLQLDGRLRAGSLDIVLRLRGSLPAAAERSLQAAYGTCLASLGLAGRLVVVERAPAWVAGGSPALLEA